MIYIVGQEAAEAVTNVEDDPAMMRLYADLAEKERIIIDQKSIINDYEKALYSFIDQIDYLKKGIECQLRELNSKKQEIGVIRY